MSQPLVRTHPLTGRKVLYANPGYTMWIDGMDRQESDTIVEYLFRHQERADFLYAHHWAVGDVLMWDNIGTVHNAIADYMPNEPRTMRRAQVMATLDYPHWWPEMSSTFTGKRIVVTGGAGGIGIETVRGFMGHGAHVVMADIDEAALARARETLGGTRLGTIASALDTPAECARVIDAAGAPVYALVHLAGLFERDELDPEDHGVWNRAIAANLTNAYDMAVAFSTRFDRREPARIVFTSSVAYRRGSADRVPYAAAKGGIVGLTRALSRKLAPDVLVNAIAPGVIETRMADSIIAERGEAYLQEIPLKRFGKPSEIASVIRFLCSPDASYITGQTITIDGGITNS